ncbi:hypothetical protein EVAR_89082_1 [Eumeta japonica]|uniref:Uncharacterized protein n=1 Tax=Eumeta variegata TaxID=151549 RepID=A0A4C1XEV7_EUMVA|nr:hypothetical protein EVAR_89082_1 [Eumeta japonica]
MCLVGMKRVRYLSILWNQYSILWIDIRSGEADSRVSEFDAFDSGPVQAGSFTCVRKCIAYSLIRLIKFTLSRDSNPVSSLVTCDLQSRPAQTWAAQSTSRSLLDDFSPPAVIS